MKRPIIIAECCQSHNGSFDLLMRMLDTAAAAGADFVKIQSIRSNQVTHRERFDAGETAADGTTKVIKRPFAAERDRLATLDLNLEQEARFVEACRRAGVKSMTTPFARSTVKEIAPLGFDGIKAASYDCGALPFLRDLVANWKTVVVSTGATTDEEIAAAAKLLRESGRETYLLHCVTIYPTPPKEMHLARLEFLRLQLDRVGLSCHPRTSELGIDPDKIALALGADCVERHYTVLGSTESRDGPVSITPAQLKELRAFADLPIEERRERVRREVPNWTDYLGSAVRPLSHAELLNRDYYRGRFASPVDGGFVYNWEEKAVS
jgi:N,N'-diacetyllegionaminate synthase